MLNLAEKFWRWKENNKRYIKYRLMAYAGLAGTLRNEGKDHKAGRIFIEAYESGVESKEQDDYHMTIKFNNGCTFKLWIANKMYAYGSGSYKVNQKSYRINGLLPKWVNLVAYSVEKSEK